MPPRPVFGNVSGGCLGSAFEGLALCVIGAAHRLAWRGALLGDILTIYNLSTFYIVQRGETACEASTEPLALALTSCSRAWVRLTRWASPAYEACQHAVEYTLLLEASRARKHAHIKL